ncbi:hypothetical protein CsSME_00036675 [Camellia sinensis var. sinensis]
MMRRQDQQSRVFCELSALILNLLRSPPTPIQFSDPSPAAVPSARRRPETPPISPAGFASLLLGISLALMLCGSVTFFIGFMLMPWVLGLVMVFYVVGIVSSLSMIGRAILCHTTSPASPRKEVPEPQSQKCRHRKCVETLVKVVQQLRLYTMEDSAALTYFLVGPLAMYKEKEMYQSSCRSAAEFVDTSVIKNY